MFPTKTSSCSSRLISAPMATASRQEQHQLKGNVFISGCDSGIGFSLARRLRKEEYQVFAGVLTSEGGEEMRELGIHPIRMDVTSDEEVKRACEEVARQTQGEGLQAFIANAGVGGALSPSETLPLASFNQQLQVNLVGTLRTLQHVIPLLSPSSQGKAKIIIMGSVSGSITFPFTLGYSVSKAGQEALADSLRCEFALSGKDDDLAVSLIKPGPIRTPIWTKLLKLTQELDHAPDEYKEAIGYAEAFAQGSLKAAAPCERLDDLVLKVLQAQSPRPRYHVEEWKDRFSIFLRRTLPDEIWDKIITFIIKQK